MYRKKFYTVFILSALLLSLLSCSSHDPAESTESVSDDETVVQVSSQAETTESASKSENNTTASEPTRSQIDQSTPDDEQGDEPASPLRQIQFYQAEQGVRGRKAEAFFEQLSEYPLYYSYQSRNSENDEKLNIVMAIDAEQRLYARYENMKQSIEIISPVSGQYYLVDSDSKTFAPVAETEIEAFLITPKMTSSMMDGANRLYFIGSGKAKFEHTDTDFEEYTRDNQSFIRYYFNHNQPLGHRIFRDGQLQSEIVINKLSDQIDAEEVIFEIPSDYVETPVSESDEP